MTWISDYPLTKNVIGFNFSSHKQELSMEFCRLKNFGPLSAEILEKELPDIDWDKGHSGIELTPTDAPKLIGLWDQYCSALKAEYRENSDQICFLYPTLDVFDTDSEEE